MLMLALSTSSQAASAALMQNGAVLAERVSHEEHTHSETLMPLMEALLFENGFSPADIDAFAVDIGPGSFTGVRIGVCAANAMALALGRPVFAVSSLMALAHAVSSVHTPVVSLIDSRNGNGYAAIYRGSECLLEPSAVTVNELLGTLSGDYVFTGDGVPVYRDVITAALPSARFCEPQLWLPTASAVGQCALKSPNESADEVFPLYLRPSQAERLYAEKNK